jgi:predicted Rossmann fold flavoprotein
VIYDAAIIGGGAAGLFCAITAGKRGQRVVVLEHNAEVGRKIVISGGGRCNFTNTGTTADNFISQNPHFPKSALAAFTPQDFVDLVKSHRIPFYEKKLGQLFCRDNSRAIVQMLLDECRAAKVEVRTSSSVNSVSRSDVYNLETSAGTIRARKLVIACGGLSFPKVGASDLGYRIARQFGLKIIETRPSLVALVLDKPQPGLAGVSVDAEVASDKRRFRENILFTHRGLSGPAILQASNYWRADKPVSIDLLPEVAADELVGEMNASQKSAVNLLSQYLPKRFAEAFAPEFTRELPLNKLRSDERGRLVRDLKNWEVMFRATEGWDRAEVTLGGVSTDELSSQTMECRTIPGLYFIGEIVDVTGWLGGYNFQWAWASGSAAGGSL